MTNNKYYKESNAYGGFPRRRVKVVINKLLDSLAEPVLLTNHQLLLPTVLIYLLLSLLLFATELLYIRLAKKYFIVDKPNERSSHSQQTVRGGGIVFWFALLFFFIRHHTGFLLFFSGLTIVALISFYDDLRTIGQWPRLLSHLAGITLAALSLNLFHLYPWYAIAAGYIVFIGILHSPYLS